MRYQHRNIRLRGINSYLNTSNKEIKSSLKNETIHSILNFSKSLVVNKSLNKTIEFVEYNLN